MIADTASIRSRLEDLQDLPVPVDSWLIKVGVDATDDPAVWVWAVLDRDALEMDMDSRGQLKSMVRKVVRDETGLWTYVLIRGTEETEAIS